MKNYWCHIYTPATGEHELVEVQFPFDNVSGINAYQQYMNQLYYNNLQGKMCFFYALEEEARKAMAAFDKSHKDDKHHLIVIHTDCYDILPKTPYPAYHIKHPLTETLLKQKVKFNVLDFIGFQNMLYQEFSYACKGMNLSASMPSPKYKENVMFSIKDSLYETAKYYYDFAKTVLKSTDDYKYTFVLTNRLKDVSLYKTNTEGRMTVTFTAWNIYKRESYKEFIFDNTFYYEGNNSVLSLDLAKEFHKLQCRFHNYDYPHHIL